MAMLARRTSPFTDISERFERMFEDMIDGEGAARRPAIDVMDTDDAIVMHAEVPGLAPDEVTIELSDDVLTIRGRHEESSEQKEGRFMRRERRIGAFARSIALPSGTDPESIAASCKDGVLEVRIPHPRKAEPKTIEVKAES